MGTSHHTSTLPIMLSQSFIVLSALLFAVNAQDCAGGPPKGVIPKECCPGACPKLITRAIAEECGLPIELVEGPPPSGGPGGPGGPGPGGKAITCEAAQCALKKNNLLTADNKINKSALKAHMETAYSADWKPIIDKIIQTCDSGTNIDASDECEARKYANCLRKTAFLSCPASVAVNSADCNQLRTFIQTCTMKN